jgi:hypothetical protein
MKTRRRGNEIVRLKSSFKIIFFCFFLSISKSIYSQFDGNQTPTYPKLVSFYDSLAKKRQVELYNMGTSDHGLPIYLCVLNGEKDSLKTFSTFKEKTNIFVNNGIHPGEPDGINACGKITLDFIKGKFKMKNRVTFSFILCYNVGGAMNRGSYSRANQDGPEEYGFRGNAKNLDLNRDFIKMDSENSLTFAKIFHAINPDIFVDTHVSNGADYQYTLTLIHSLKERLEPAYQIITYKHFIPMIEKEMLKHKIELSPYVESISKTPDDGIEAFNDLPRYAMGYASLFPCISVTTETHMLKPFPERVEATYLYLKEITYWAEKKYKVLANVRRLALESQTKQQYFRYNFQRTDKYDSILFKGYEAKYKKSEVTELQRLYYDKSIPYSKYIKYYNDYKALDSSKIPLFYVIGSENKEIIKKMKQNGVEMRPLKKDTTINLTYYFVNKYETASKPYEGHYLHHSADIVEKKGQIKLKKGDLYINTRQNQRKFICSVLEPQAEDSYFNWNYFDSYLQEKEYFSDYVFEDLATEILSNNLELKTQFEEKKIVEETFRNSQWEQLYFIYKNSKYFEADFMCLPVYKIY